MSTSKKQITTQMDLEKKKAKEAEERDSLFSKAQQYIQESDYAGANGTLNNIANKVKGDSTSESKLGDMHYDIARKWCGDHKKMKHHLDQASGFGSQSAQEALKKLDRSENPFSGQGLGQIPSHDFRGNPFNPSFSS